jgi:hypothetical protein
MAMICFSAEAREVFISPQHPDWLWEISSFLSNVYLGCSSPWVKRPDHVADHSFTFTAEVKNGGHIYLHSHIPVDGVVLN